MKALLIGDVHLADRPPRALRDIYTDNLFDMLREALQFAREIDAYPICAGDLFHHKAPNRNSHELVARAIELFSINPLYLVLGNHDISQDNYTTLYRQAVSPLIKAGVVDIHPPDPEIAFWKWGDEIKSPPEWRDAKLIVAHAPIARPNESPPWEYISPSVAARLAGNSGTIFYGHIHEDVGTFEHEGVQFVNNGALCRGSLSDSDVSRLPVVTIFDDGHIKRHPLKTALKPEELYREGSFDDSEVTAPKIDIASWAESLSNATKFSLSPREIAQDAITSADVSDEVRKEALSLLEEVDV